MATTRLMPLHVGKGATIATALGRTADYVENPDKTDGGEWISSYECDAQIVDDEFLFSKRQYAMITGRDQGKKDVIAYHLRQSFKPGEIDPATANKIGYELAMSLTKGKHAFLICTHVDKNHIHSHIVFNSTTLDCTHKFRNFLGSSFAIRKISDVLCIQNGLSFIEKPKSSRGSYGTWIGDEKAPTIRECLKDLIDENLEKSTTLDEFKNVMRKSGCEVKHKAHLAFKIPDGKLFIRCTSLGEDYSENELIKRLGCERKSKSLPERKAIATVKSKPSMLIDIEAKLQQGKGTGYANWAKVFNLKEAAKTLIYLQENGLDDYEVLAEKSEVASEKFSSLSDELKSAEKRISEIKNLQKHIIAYAKHSEVYKAYKKSGYNQDFFEANREEITLVKAARETFKALKLEKLPTMKSLKEESDMLQAKKNKLHSQYKIARQEMMELQLAKHNIEMILGEQTAHKNQQKSSRNER